MYPGSVSVGIFKPSSIIHFLSIYLSDQLITPLYVRHDTAAWLIW